MIMLVRKNREDFTPDDWQHVAIVRHGKLDSFWLRGRVTIGGWLPGDLKALGLPNLRTRQLSLMEARENGGKIEAKMVRLERGHSKDSRK